LSPLRVIRLENPIPVPALRSVNTYLLCTEDCCIVVDPGMGPRSAEVLSRELRSRRLRAELVVATHFHVDHLTAAGWLDTRIAIGRRDWERVLFMVDRWPQAVEELAALFTEHGMPYHEARALERAHPAFSRIKWYERLVDIHRRDVHLLDDGSRVEACDLTLHVVSVPGHTPGHISLRLSGTEIIVGDHVLNGITPNIALLDWNTNPLMDYLNSLRRLLSLRPRTLLPGHRSPITNPKARIEELIKHHYRRLEEVVEILSRLGEANAYQVAARMKWDVPFRSWSEFPLHQKYFALAEALSHLRVLVANGVVEVVEKDNGMVFRLKQSTAR
jgi:glyoxylase-like metal-dependent hydrolase (beta-lactamase superfamily II)